MTPRRPRPLCAICADREATTITDWECESGATRTIVACWPCLSPVPDPPEEYEPVDLADRVAPDRISARRCNDHGTREAVLAAVARLGEATTADIVATLKIVGDKARDTVGKTISRLYRAGLLVGRDLYPGSPNAGRVYAVAKEQPRAA